MVAMPDPCGDMTRSGQKQGKQRPPPETQNDIRKDYHYACSCPTATLLRLCGYPSGTLVPRGCQPGTKPGNLVVKQHYVMCPHRSLAIDQFLVPRCAIL